MALGVVLTRQLAASALPEEIAAPVGPLSSVVLDIMLIMPAAALAIWMSSRLLARLRLTEAPTATRAALVSLLFAALSVPMVAAQGLAYLLAGGASGTAHHHAEAGHGLLVLSGLAGDGLRYALLAQPVVFVFLLVAMAARQYRVDGQAVRSASRRVLVAASAVVLGAALLPVWVASSASAAVAAPNSVPPDPAAPPAGECATAPQRSYDIVALNVDITVDRFGDHDPFGYMYAMAAKEAEIRAREAALQEAARDTTPEPTDAKVKTGLRDDIIQPLVLRARLGECLVLNLTNKLTEPPRGGPGFTANPFVVQPGGVPDISIDLQGVSYDAAGGDGGEAVGNNPGSVMIGPGESHTYRFYLDPAMGEGGRVFRSGGDSEQLTAHGLFGAVIAEPEGAQWYDAQTGTQQTNNKTWSNWEATVSEPNQPSFREFAILYHEIGDENFNLRRPQREPGELLHDPGDGNGAPILMLDEVSADTQGGGATDSYRPGSRALNYRSEPFWRRLKLLHDQLGHDTERLLQDESLAYGSYMFGDPATPMPRSYLGEPTKTRLMHAGFEQMHVHHLHGGGDRWRQNPEVEPNSMFGGLRKGPQPDPKTMRLDSQTIGPEESYNLEHECGAGGCQQAAGDFLYHCHIAHHYIAGMWGFWRVLDTAQPDLAPLHGQQKPAGAVNSAALQGKTIEGKNVVLRANLTDPSTQIALEDLVESQLPPQGVRANDNDATVWDWQKGGTPTRPVYLGEPETTEVWANYQSPTPGERPEILFNPNNGRPAWPMMRPHLGKRPPFAPNKHSGAPWLGENASSARPDGLCPSGAPMKRYNITAISAPVQVTDRARDADGMVFVLNEDKDRVKQDAENGTKSPVPLVIRSNVGDCVAVTLSSELNPAVQHKVNMHTHFVQFDPQASDGVITGMSFEQSVYSDDHDSDRTTAASAPAGSDTVTVSAVGDLVKGVAVAVGAGRPNIEIRTITAIAGNTLTLDKPLDKDHAANEPVSVEFVQYRWYSDVDSGAVFWHDHVNGIKSWAHGLFGAHVIEPAGSTYHDPQTGAEIRSGPIADIHTDGRVGEALQGSFREFMMFLTNGQRGRPESAIPRLSGGGGQSRNFGQECEEGTFNLRAEPIGERVPSNVQRQEFNGSVEANGQSACRTATSNDRLADASNTVPATVNTVDPYVFSSVKYGDPNTPLLRAYAGDPTVVRVIGVNERVEALRIQGHRFHYDRHNSRSAFTDSASAGISERFDFVLDGGAGGKGKVAGDYLYYSTRPFAFETGAWGIFRVHDTLRTDLQPLPGRTPPSGVGFPVLQPATGDTQENPGPNPPSATTPGVVTDATDPCPSSARDVSYDVSIFDHTLPTAPHQDTGGVIYALTSDKAAIEAADKRVEPLVLRANVGDCVVVTLHNDISADSQFGGTRAGFDLAEQNLNVQIGGGSAIGLNPDTTIGRGESITLRYHADVEGTSIFQNLGSEASVRHGAYGMLIVEPEGSTWSDSHDNSALGSTKTGSEAIIRTPTRKFREVALTFQTTDQQYGRSIVPYQDVVAGSGVNSTFVGNPPVADKAFNHVSYHSEPITTRLGLDGSNPDPDFGSAFSSGVHGDPDTPVFRAYSGDDVVFRVAVPSSDQMHSFTVAGHMYPLHPNWAESHLLTSRTVASGQAVDADLVGGAGLPGDYMYRDGRQPFMEAGIWGIFRVHPSGTTLPDLARL